MSVSARAYAAFQASNPEAEFNDRLVYWRSEDEIKDYLEDVFVALEVVPGIKLIDVTVEKDESKFPDSLRFGDIEVSRMDLAIVRFRIEVGDQHEEVELPLLLPKLIDNFFYILNGSLYYPILQLVDRGTYVTKKTFTLKTLLMPLVFRTDVHAEPVDLTDDSAYPAMLYILDLFRSKINVLTYFFAKAGLAGTLDYFGAGEKLQVTTGDQVAGLDPERWMAFAVEDNELAVVVDREWVDSEQEGVFALNLAATLADALKGVSVDIVAMDGAEGITEEQQAQVDEYWLRRLGKHFTKNPSSYIDKAQRILVSLERILDRRTQKNLAHVVDADKENVYAICRWMMRDYDQLRLVNNMDVRTKRIRLSEYLIHPLLLRFSDSTYRLLNSQTLTFGRIKSIFKNVGPGFLIRKLGTNDLLRYSGCVNQHDLLTTALRFTTRGPQSMGERGKGDLSLQFRGHDPSYVGRIGLAAASASDPGASGTLIPFAKTSGPFFE